MRKAINLLLLGVFFAATFAGCAWSQAKPASGFERLKTLAGTWQADTPEHGTLTNNIRLVSNGTALEETFQSSESDQMVTLYTPDGNRLAMTHYCAAGNQPRMETTAVTGEQTKFEFSFTGITNLLTPNSGHMCHLEIQIADPDHFTEVWTWRENGKDQFHAIHFTRKET
jgi:hypothetical protein